MKNHFSKIHLKDDSGLELSIFLIKNVLSINIYYRKLIQLNRLKYVKYVQMCS